MLVSALMCLGAAAYAQSVSDANPAAEAGDSEKMFLIHWGEAKKSETLLRAAPRGCLNKPKKE